MMEFFQGSFHLLAYIALVELFIYLRSTVNYVIFALFSLPALE